MIPGRLLVGALAAWALGHIAHLVHTPRRTLRHAQLFVFLVPAALYLLHAAL